MSSAILQRVRSEVERRKTEADALAIWSAVGLGNDPRINLMRDRGQKILDDKQGEVIPSHLRIRPDHEKAFSLACKRLESMERLGHEPSDILTFSNLLKFQIALQAALNVRACEVIKRRFPEMKPLDPMREVEKSGGEWARIHWNTLEESALIAPWNYSADDEWKPTIEAVRVDYTHSRVVPHGVSIAVRVRESSQGSYLGQFEQEHKALGWTVQERTEADLLGHVKGRVVVVKTLSSVQ